MSNTAVASCGTCTMCCKLPSIQEMEKPAGTWCKLCVPKQGCADYHNRPQSCRQFECLWLHSQKPQIESKLRFPDDMRPDICSVILSKKPDGTLFALVPTDRPDAWKKGKIGDWLRRENQVRPVTIVCGDKLFPMT